MSADIDVRSLLLRQLDIAWRLTEIHLDGLTDAECLWRPAERGLHVWPDPAGGWSADWPEHEGYDLGPASIAWLTWHLGFWWSMVLDHSFGAGELAREDVRWPGGAADAVDWISGLARRWRDEVETLSPADLAAPDRSRWPVRDRPFADVVAWVNLELMKNAAEIGYVRFLHAGSRSLAPHRASE